MDSISRPSTPLQLMQTHPSWMNRSTLCLIPVLRTDQTPIDINHPGLNFLKNYLHHCRPRHVITRSLLRTSWVLFHVTATLLLCFLIRLACRISFTLLKTMKYRSIQVSSCSSSDLRHLGLCSFPMRYVHDAWGTLTPPSIDLLRSSMQSRTHHQYHN